MTSTRLARISDARRICELLSANTGDRGGMLTGRWSVEAIENRIAKNQKIIVAIGEDETLLGVLLTCEKGFDDAPPVHAMLKAWPGRDDAYVYGPVCVASEARGQGILEALYKKLCATHAGREAVLFIRADNPRSLRAHLRLGLLEVARYELNGESFVVLSNGSPSVTGERL
jgi:GNAT superfamily N-acetyltransferase